MDYLLRTIAALAVRLQVHHRPGLSCSKTAFRRSALADLKRECHDENTKVLTNTVYEKLTDLKVERPDFVFQATQLPG